MEISKSFEFKVENGKKHSNGIAITVNLATPPGKISPCMEELFEVLKKRGDNRTFESLSRLKEKFPHDAQKISALEAILSSCHYVQKVTSQTINWSSDGGNFFTISIVMRIKKRILPPRFMFHPVMLK